MLRTRWKSGLAALAAVLLILSCQGPNQPGTTAAGDLSRDVEPAAATIKVSGKVVDSATNAGVAGASVVVFGTKTQEGDGTAAKVAETVTGADGAYSVTLASFGTGDWLTFKVFAAQYKQSTRTDTVFYTNGTKTGVTIKAVNKEGSANKEAGLGLRESYYGLTNPYFGDGSPTLFPYPQGYQTSGLVDHWRYSHTVSNGDAVRPLHVLIVTQTEPSSFQGQVWDYENGPTYCLWKQVGTNPDPAHLIFADKLKDIHGKPLTTSQIDLDAILSSYDAWGHDVFLQVESGHADMTKLIPLVLKRFYKENGVVKHPSVKGFGVDVEWFNNTNPNDDSNADNYITPARATQYLSQVAGFNPNLKLFLKHYSQGDAEATPPTGPVIMPTCSKAILYVDDSQGFASEDACTSEMAAWAALYSPADVGFQIGYDTAMFEKKVDADGNPIPIADRLPRDMRWWGAYADPQKKIATDMLAACESEPARAYNFVWVDFSARVSKISDGTPNGGFPYIEAVTPPAIVGPWPPLN